MMQDISDEIRTEVMGKGASQVAVHAPLTSRTCRFTA